MAAAGLQPRLVLAPDQRADRRRAVADGVRRPDDIKQFAVQEQQPVNVAGHATPRRAPAGSCVRRGAPLAAAAGWVRTWWGRAPIPPPGPPRRLDHHASRGVRAGSPAPAPACARGIGGDRESRARRRRGTHGRATSRATHAALTVGIERDLLAGAPRWGAPIEPDLQDTARSRLHTGSQAPSRPPSTAPRRPRCRYDRRSGSSRTRRKALANARRQRRGRSAHPSPRPGRPARTGSGQPPVPSRRSNMHEHTAPRSTESGNVSMLGSSGSGSCTVTFVARAPACGVGRRRSRRC